MTENESADYRAVKKATPLDLLESEFKDDPDYAILKDNSHPECDLIWITLLKIYVSFSCLMRAKRTFRETSEALTKSHDKLNQMFNKIRAVALLHSVYSKQLDVLKENLAFVKEDNSGNIDHQNIDKDPFVVKCHDGLEESISGYSDNLETLEVQLNTSKDSYEKLNQTLSIWQDNVAFFMTLHADFVASLRSMALRSTDGPRGIPGPSPSLEKRLKARLVSKLNREQANIALQQITRQTYLADGLSSDGAFVVRPRLWTENVSQLDPLAPYALTFIWHGAIQVPMKVFRSTESGYVDLLAQKRRFPSILHLLLHYTVFDLSDCSLKSEGRNAKLVFPVLELCSN